MSKATKCPTKPRRAQQAGSLSRLVAAGVAGRLCWSPQPLQINWGANAKNCPKTFYCCGRG